MISKVILENFRSHSHTELEFGKGTNVLVGKMGSGKTSVASAICFGLFGTFPELEAKKVSLEETILSRPNPAEKAMVRVEFDYSGKEYAVERIISKRGSSAKLFCGTRLLAGPQAKEVTRQVEEILKMDYGLFSRAVYAEQNQIDYFLRLSPQQRREKIDSLLGIDRYENARAGATTLKNTLDRIASEKRSLLVQWEKGNAMREIAELEKRIAEKQRKIISIAEEAAGAKERAVKSKGRFEEMRVEGERFAKAKDNFVRLEAKLQRQREELESLCREGGILEEGKAGELERKAKEMKAKAEEAERNARKELAAVEREIAGLEAIARNAGKGAIELGKISSKCPTCGRPLAEHDKKELLRERELEAEEAKKKIVGAEQKRKGFEEEEKAARSEQRKAVEEERIASRAIEGAKKVAEAKKMESALEEAEAVLKKIGFDEKKFEETRKKALEEAEAARRMEAEERHEKELQAEFEKGLERLRKEQERIEKAKEDVKRVEGLSGKVALFNSALKETQASLRETMLSAVNQAMDDVWPKLYPYHDLETAKIVVEKGDYEIMARGKQGKWIRAEGLLSGGEKSAVALTTRIAISLVLTQNLSWLILDEPTHNLDSKSIQVFAELLRNHLPKLVEQVFVITHEKELEKAASCFLYELDRNKDSDGSTVHEVQAV